MRHLFLAILTAGLLLALSVTSTLAVGLHQHYITTPSGAVVPIAQGICANHLQTAIDQLHANVHLGEPGQAFASNPVALHVGSCP
ncbi:MAG TPA: hypothetical protein VF364_06725 [Candidatus Limnocylindria bacterium]